ncbi:MAG: DsbA family protein [Inquilinus sp.]|nr:DsbA family protein [Inquilinus sp.]
MRRRVLIVGGAVVAAAGIAGAVVLRRSEDAIAAGSWDPAITPFDKVLGSANAPVTIVEYASFTCPHCATFHTDTWPTLKERFVDSGQVRFVFRDFPLNEPALRAGMMARCVPEDRYFSVVEVIFSTLDQWSNGDWRQGLGRIGRLAGLSQEAFDACLADKALEEQILGLRLAGQQLYDINSTPSFVINGKTFGGGRTIEQFADIIEDASGA